MAPHLVGHGPSQPIDREAVLLPEPMEGWVAEQAGEAGDGLEFCVRLPAARASREGAEGWVGFFVGPTGSYIPGTELRVVRMRDPWCAVCRWEDARPARPPTGEVRLLPPAPGAPVERARVAWPPPRTSGSCEAGPPAPAPVDARVIVLWSVIDGALEFEVSWSDGAEAELAEGWTGAFLDEAGEELPGTELTVLRIKDPRRALCRWVGARSQAPARPGRAATGSVAERRSNQLPSGAVRMRPPIADPAHGR